MWTKLDDQYPDHPKIIAVGPLAAWLHTCAVIYCGRYLTDGLIPARIVPQLVNFDGVGILTEEGWQPVDETLLVTALVTAKIWTCNKDGYAIHDYLKYNPSAAKVQADRAKDAKRLAEWREKHTNAPKPPDSRPERVTKRVTKRVTNAVSTEVPSPSPLINPSTSVEGGPAPAETPKKPQRDPDLDHPAVVAYRDKCKLTPNATQRQAIAGTVTDIPRWSDVIGNWLLRNYRKDNVAGMLDWYRDGIPERSNGNDNRSATRGASGLQSLKAKERYEYREPTAEELAEFAAAPTGAELAESRRRAAMSDVQR